MKRIIYAILVVGFASAGAITAKNLVATVHHSITSSTVINHSGRTDASGCHHDYKTGGYLSTINSKD
jgi:hypothetical protein